MSTVGLIIFAKMLMGWVIRCHPPLAMDRSGIASRLMIEPTEASAATAEQSRRSARRGGPAARKRTLSGWKLTIRIMLDEENF